MISFDLCFHHLCLNIHAFSLDLRNNTLTGTIPVSVGVGLGMNVVMWAQGSCGRNGGDVCCPGGLFTALSSLGVWVSGPGVTLTGLGYLWHRCSTHTSFTVAKQQLIIAAISFLTLRVVSPQEWRSQGDVGEQQGVAQTGGHEAGGRGECITGPSPSTLTQILRPFLSRWIEIALYSQLIAKGKNASELFPAVVKNVASKNIEVLESTTRQSEHHFLWFISCLLWKRNNCSRTQIYRTSECKSKPIRLGSNHNQSTTLLDCLWPTAPKHPACEYWSSAAE